MQWFDAHVHIGNDAGGISAPLDEVQTLLEDNWLDKAVVFCMNEEQGIGYGNDLIRDTVADREDMVGLFRVDPAIHDPEDLADTDAFAGFKMHPRAQDFGMQEVYQHLDVIGETGKPVIVHTGVGDTHGYPRAHPEEVLNAASIHQDTDMVLAHTTKGYYFHAPDSFLDTFKALDNAYMDISLHCTPLGVETLVDDLGAEKVLFASDYPYGHPGPMQQNVELADIPQEAAEQVAWKNTDRLFFQ